MTNQSARLIEVNDLVLIEPPAYALELGCVPHPNYALLKRVVALKRQRACIQGARLYIDGQDMGGGYLQNSQGQWAQPSWSGCTTLSDDEVFVLGEHPRSCDSRLFGPIKQQTIQAKAYPLWLWKADQGEQRP